MTSTFKSRRIYIFRKALGTLEKFYSLGIEEELPQTRRKGPKRYRVEIRLGREKAVNGNAWRSFTTSMVVPETAFDNVSIMQKIAEKLMHNLMLHLLDKKNSL